MNTTFRRAAVPGIAVLAIALSACGGSSSSGSSDSLSGGGSSAQTSAQAAWTAGYQTQNTSATINYDPVGSGTGRTNFFSGAYDFAGSDSALSTDTSTGTSEVAMAQARCGAPAIEVPAYVSPIAVVFNLSGITTLNLDAATIASMFDGDITMWNDPAIAADNPGVSLPATKITPVHRSDDSGTTQNFTDYLSQASDGTWTYPASQTWPIDSGASGNGTSGVITAVKGGDGTLGYADDSQAGGLGVASIKVGSDYNAPSAAGAATALADSPLATGRPASDLAVTIDRTDTTSGAYPLFLTSYLIACPTYAKAATATLVEGYLSYAVSDAGQQAAAAAAGSAPLPASLATKAQALVATITSGAAPSGASS